MNFIFMKELIFKLKLDAFLLKWYFTVEYRFQKYFFIFVGFNILCSVLHFKHTKNVQSNFNVIILRKITVRYTLPNDITPH